MSGEIYISVTHLGNHGRTASLVKARIPCPTTLHPPSAPLGSPRQPHPAIPPSWTSHGREVRRWRAGGGSWISGTPVHPEGAGACRRVKVDLRPPSNGWSVILGTTLPGRLALQCSLKVPLRASRSFASGSIRTGWGDFVQETSGFRSRVWCPVIEFRFGRTMPGLLVQGRP